HVAQRHVRRISHPAGLQADRLRRLARSQARERATMAKAYWISTYRSISNPDALAAYAKLAGPALTAAGGARQPGLSGSARRACRRSRAGYPHRRRDLARLTSRSRGPSRRRKSE